MTVKLGYAIHFVADMDRAVSFYRDTLGLTLKFASPGWSEFATGDTSLALHPASDQNPAGSLRKPSNRWPCTSASPPAKSSRAAWAAPATAHTR